MRTKQRFLGSTVPRRNTWARRCVLAPLLFGVAPALVLFGPAVLGQETKSTMITEINTQFPNNITGAITPQVLRQVTTDMVNSWQQYLAVNAQTGSSYTFQVSDYGQLVTLSNAGAIAVTLPQATGSFATWNVYVRNVGSTTATITPTTSTINGASSYSLVAGASILIVSDGANYQVFGGGNAGGSVLSVGLALPNIFTVSGSPVTNSGTLTGTLAGQTANTVFSGPSSGGSTAPTFRQLVPGDIGGTLLVGQGGTGALTFTAHGVLVGEGTSAITPLSVGATNSVLQGSTGADPAFTTTPTVGNITVTTGGGAVTLQTQGAGTYTFALPTTGGSNGQLLTTDGSGNTSWTTVTGSGTVTQIICGTGLTGGTITTSGTCAISAPVSVANGGTGNTSLTAHALQIGAGTSATTNTGAGTTGQCAVSQGASADPIFNGGCRVLLATLTASTSTSINDSAACNSSNCITSTYNDYELVFENIIPATNAVSCEIQIHSGGAYKTTGYLSAGWFTNSGSGTGPIAVTTYIPCGRTGAMFNGDPGTSGTIRIYLPSGSNKHQLVGQFTNAESATIVDNVTIGGYWNTAGVIDGFQVLMSSGNITSGTVKIYGLL